MLIVFFVLAFVAVGTAISMLLTRNAVYSALFLVLNFGAVAILYLILGAPFIALSQITVYAGSVVVLFLFVIMLLGAERLPGGEPLKWQRILAIPLVLLLAADFIMNFTRLGGSLGALDQPPANYGAPEQVGKVLFTNYALPFEVTAVILLVAAVGAIMLARGDQAVRRRDQYRAPAIQEKTETGKN
jgi:NADH-quinone oxidoreductase subunit J